ncbi:MAG: hypothetical protein RBR69_01405 [Candidatus Cloacimonadaceae bacterium]|nr:hypothetical protein [Candidatus Cloacimonadota bacterium]MDY0126782.1 hypothetical protein [Candidatus Cloacimonadaceae bacterium]
MKYYVLCLLAFCLIPLHAFHSEPFLLGAYSYLQNDKRYYSEHRDELIAHMQDLSFNINVIETTNSDPDLSSLLQALDKAKLDAALADKCWSNDPRDSRRFSLVPLSTSNYYRFEAEYTDQTVVKKGDNLDPEFWYGNSKTIPRTGQVIQDSKASNEHAWQVKRNKDKIGWAYTDITMRWPDRMGNRVKLYDEIRFHKRHLDAKSDTDSLYLTYRVKLTNIAPDLSDEAPLLSFQIYAHRGDKREFGEKIVANKRAHGKKADRTEFSLGDFKAMGSPEGYIDLPFTISYNDLRDSRIMTDDWDNNPDTPGHWWWYIFRHFAPGLYWHGNCDLSLDYIDMEDEIYRDLRQNYAFYKKSINERLRAHRALPGGNVIRYVYGMDEPFQTHLSSFNMMQGMIEEDNPPICSATYDIYHRTYKLDDKDNWWHFPDLTRDIAQPRIMMPDIYPIQPGILYDPDAGERFYQNVLDHRLLKGYRESYDYVSQSPERKFYPVVQVFGHWSGSRWWSWVMPPQATQKALMFLPLCYGADGMYQYLLNGFVSSAKVGDYAPLIGIDASELKKFDYIYDVVKELNPRILKFGEELQDWDWVGASTAMLFSNYPKLDYAESGINKLRVVQACNGSYEGYIETGLYTKDSGEYAIFAVNRRSNEFHPRKEYLNPDFVAPEDYPDAYSEFEPQTLKVIFDRDIKNPALLDMETKELYKAKRRRVKIEIPAGEARLLKIVDWTTLKDKN